jgi:hypothetical protein
MKHPHKYGARPGWYGADLKPCSKADGVYYFKSKLELEFARRLEMERRAGEVRAWEYEAHTYRLRYPSGRNKGELLCEYKPDFLVIMRYDNSLSTLSFPDGAIGYFIECKGLLRPGERRKLRVAGMLLPYPLKVYTKKFGLLPVEEYLKKVGKSK